MPRASSSVPPLLSSQMMSQQHGLSDDGDDSDKSLANSLDSPPTSTPRESFDNLAQTNVSKGSLPVLNNTQGVAASGEARGKRKRSKKNGKLPSATGGRGLGFSAGEVDSLLEILDAHQPLCKDEWEIVLRTTRNGTQVLKEQ